MNKKYVARSAAAIAVLAMCILFLVASTAPAVQACAPKITLSSSSSPVGTSVNVVGIGFGSKECVTVTYFGITTKIQTSSAGGFTLTFKVPTTAIVGKTYTVTATGSGRESACGSIYVARLFVTPESPIGPLAALGACFGAVLVYKRKSLPHLHLNIRT